MPSKTEEYLALAQRTANGLTRYWESWTDYLTTASRLYKYPFADQLMIYAQRPDATACADFDIWNNRMNRYVRRGAKGIALLDESSGFPRLHYVFDVSDTGVRRNSRDPEVWQYNDDLKQPVSEMLSKTYGISGERVSQQLADVAGKLVADYWDNNGGDIRAIVDGSLLMDYDEAGVEMQFKSAAAISVTYTLLERCGFEPAGWFDKEDFRAIHEFSTPDSVYALGAAVSDMSREVLRNIERTVKTTIRRRNNERSQYEYEQQERDLLDHRGLPAPEPDPEPAPEAAGQIRQAAPELPEAVSPGTVQFDAPERDAVPASDGTGADGREPDAADHEAASETDPSPGQGAASDGVGAAHEQPESASRGTGADGADLQLSFFDAHIPTEAEQIGKIDRAESEKTPSAFVLSQAEIENELRKHGSGFEGGKQRIMTLYQAQPDRSLRAKALAKEYGTGGHSYDFLDGSRGFVNHDWKGLEFDHYPDHQKITLKWAQVEKYIDLMIQSDRYLTDKEKEHYTPPVPITVEPDATLTHAKNLIRDFCQEEYDSEPDFSDLTKIAIAYTHATDEDIPIQVNVDLVGYRVERYLGDILVDERQYETLEDLTETELEALDFSELVSVTDEELEHYHSKAEERPVLLPLDAAAECNALKEQHPDALVGFEQNGQFEFYGEDARRVCELLGGKFLEKETALGTVPVTGFPCDQWVYRAKQLWQRGETVYLAGLNEDGTHYQTKYLRREDYLPLDAIVHMEGRSFRVDTVNFDKGSVILQDVALAEMRIPVFREEPLALVRELYEEQDMMESPLPDYKVGDNVVVELPTRTIEGKVGYVGETDVRIDTSAHGQSWDNEVVNKQQFEEGLRQNEPNSTRPVRTEKTVAVYPAKENNLPFDIVIQTISTESPTVEAEHPAPEPAGNFHITDDHLGEGGAKQKYARNIEAIRTLFKLEEEHRGATAEEQQVLSQYVGWGGLSDTFDPGKDNWAKEYAELKGLLSEDEYAAARSSTLNAHYTSPVVIRSIYDAVEKMGFQSGNILEPSMGVGNFFGMLPDTMADSRLYGVELDSITGRIAKKLYPQADITVAGFETTDRRDFYDLAVGNVPFGQYKVNDKAYNKLGFSIHNYFFAKAIPMQKEACRNFAESQGWEIIKEFSEKGVSGFKKSAKDRDELQKIQQAAMEGKFDILLVFMFDRLGRRDDETPFIVEWFTKQGIEVWSVNEGQQRFDTHVDKLMNYIRYWQASGESLKTSVRTRTRLEQLTGEGHYTGGTVAFGYKRVRLGRVNKKNQEVCDLVIDEAEAEIVRLIFHKYVYEGYGAQKLSHYLYEQGVVGRNNKNIPNTSIVRMIKNKGYTGYLINGAVETECPQLRIIEPELFEQAQELRQARTCERGGTSLGTSSKALLTGLVYCAHCGNRLSLTSSGRTHTYADGHTVKEVRPRYSCFYKIRHPGDCDGQSGYGVSKLDSIVEEVVRQIFAQFREVSRKKLLESVKTNDAARIQKKVKKIQKDLEAKQKELDDLKAETILVIRGVSALDKELLGTLVAEAREALETLEKQLVQAQEEYEEATKTAKRSNYICNELFTWADVYDTANHDERRAILQQFIKEIRVRKDYEISITLNASFNQVEQLKAVSTYDGAEIFEEISEKGA